MDSQTELRRVVSHVLKTRKISQTAFAKSVGINRSQLAQVLTGKKSMRLKAAEKYLKPILDRRTWKRIEEGFQFEREGLFERNTIPIDDFTNPAHVLYHSDPLVHAVQLCLDLNGYDGTARYISKRLNLPVGEVVERLKLLKQLGLVVREKSKWRATNKRGTGKYGPQLPSAKAYRRAFIELMKKRNDTVTTEDIFFWGQFNVINREDVESFRREFRELRDRYEKRCRLSAPNNLYALMMCMLPFED